MCQQLVGLDGCEQCTVQADAANLRLGERKLHTEHRYLSKDVRLREEARAELRPVVPHETSRLDGVRDFSLRRKAPEHLPIE